ncbi:MAG TPA: AIR synthase-related protein, partial [Trebonia sp.]
MLADSAGGGPMLDLVGTAIGALPPLEPTAQAPGSQQTWRQALDGSAVRPGDAVIGLLSSGLHSNGYSLARHALFRKGGMSLEDIVPGTGRRLADALLQPTRVYVKAAEALWAAGITPHGMVHISGGGLLNLARLAADVSYELDAMVPTPEIFTLIAQRGEISPATMYGTFNMGLGFCVVVAKADQQAALDVLKQIGEDSFRVGWVIERSGKTVSIPSAGVLGRGDAFEQVR